MQGTGQEEAIRRATPARCPVLVYIYDCHLVLWRRQTARRQFHAFAAPRYRILRRHRSPRPNVISRSRSSAGASTHVPPRTDCIIPDLMIYVRPERHGSVAPLSVRPSVRRLSALLYFCLTAHARRPAGIAPSGTRAGADQRRAVVILAACRSVGQTVKTRQQPAAFVSRPQVPVGVASYGPRACTATRAPRLPTV